MGHGAGHVLIDRHALLHGALHANQTDTELVLQELSDRTDPSVAKMVNVVDLADVASQFEQILDRRVEILRREHAMIKRRDVGVTVQLDIELHPPDTREVVLLRGEEHAFKQGPSCLASRRIPRAKLAVDFQQGFVLGLYGVFAQG